jgi:hypothetical protein
MSNTDLTKDQASRLRSYKVPFIHLSSSNHIQVQLNISKGWTKDLSICSVLISQDLIGSSLIGRLKIWTLTWPHTGCR